jgi:DNA-binding NtrC family response regulator
MNDRILIAEDEAVQRINLREFLQDSGFEVDAATNGEEALKQALAEDYAVVITDLRMPGLDGIGLLKHLMAERPESSVLITTAYASVDSAVDALRHGAYDYILKPIVPEELLQKLNNLISYRALRDEVVRLRRTIQDRLGFAGIVGSSAGIRGVFELVERVAPTQSTVLITGESGTGKELVARSVHANSKLNEREFLAINLAAIPEHLVESHLFGHEQGAFTGAAQRREGVLRAAGGGTVFLDEIGELTPQIQAKLLRVIENREFFPVGGDRPTRAEFRLIAATNQHLEQQVEKGGFRQDLFFRLNVFRIEVPPLRQRRSDIPALVDHFVTRHCRSIGKKVTGIANDTMRLLIAYRWPGNVRELSNVVERGVLLADGELLQPDHLPAEIRNAPLSPTGLHAALHAFERQHISRILSEQGGDKELTARVLNIHLATLYRRLEKLQIEA